MEDAAKKALESLLDFLLLLHERSSNEGSFDDFMMEQTVDAAGVVGSSVEDVEVFIESLKQVPFICDKMEAIRERLIVDLNDWIEDGFKPMVVT